MSGVRGVVFARFFAEEMAVDTIGSMSRRRRQALRRIDSDLAEYTELREREREREIQTRETMENIERNTWSECRSRGRGETESET